VSLTILDSNIFLNLGVALSMQEHYHRLKREKPNAELPRILGMTASPIFNPKDPAKSIEYVSLHAPSLDHQLIINHLTTANLRGISTLDW
jgi:hypothetical protein